VSGIRTKPSPDCFFFLLHLYQPQQPRWRFARDLGCRDRSVQPFGCFPGAFVPWDSASASASTHSLIGLTDAIRSRPAGLPTFRLSASCLVSNLSDLSPEERSDNELAYTCIPICDINTISTLSTYKATVEIHTVHFIPCDRAEQSTLHRFAVNDELLYNI